MGGVCGHVSPPPCGLVVRTRLSAGILYRAVLEVSSDANTCSYHWPCTFTSGCLCLSVELTWITSTAGPCPTVWVPCQDRRARIVSLPRRFPPSLLYRPFRTLEGLRFCRSPLFRPTTPCPTAATRPAPTVSVPSRLRWSTSRNTTPYSRPTPEPSTSPRPTATKSRTPS